MDAPLAALDNERPIGAGLAGKTPTLRKLIGTEGCRIAFSNGKRTREHAHPAAAALARSTAREFDAVRGEAGGERAAAREFELDGERLETDAETIGRRGRH